MKHSDLERRMIEAARDYNDPPVPPREEMWAVIRESLPQAAEARGREKPSPASVRRLYRWTPWALGLAAAATLAIGFGLGRITEQAPPAAPVAAGTRGPDQGRPSLPARMAAANHMGEAEAMLTLYRSTDRSEDREATAAWARDLLGTTRMMMDSRVGDDREMFELLADLELVLVQIANAAVDPSEDDLIEDGIQERQLMTKLRSAASPVEGVAL